MDTQIDGQTDGWKDRQMKGQIKELTDRLIIGYSCSCVKRQMASCVDRQMDGQTDKWKDS